MRRIVAAGAIGGVLEWYDFAIFGYFALEIGQAFFPRQDPVAQLLAAFGVFAVGYVMRPLGGLISGSIGDRLGRRAALAFSMATMALPTFLVAVLPGHQTLGAAAPILLTVLRMLQGLSVGGECTTAFTFVIEHAPPHRRGLAGATTLCGNTAGILLGSATGALLSELMPADMLRDWGWRLPFLAGLPVGLMGFWLRRHVPESTQSAGAASSPVGEMFRHHGGMLARLAALASLGAVSFYIIFLYAVSWLQLVDGVTPARALGLNTVAMTAVLPTFLAAGWLSDRYGRQRLLLGAAAAAFLGAVPLFWLMRHGDPVLILAGQMGFVLIVGTVFSVELALMVEATPPDVRCTLVALGFNIPAGVLGGLTPLAATWLVDRTALNLSPAFLVMAAAAVTFSATLTFRDTRTL